MGLVPIVIGGSTLLYVLTLLVSGRAIFQMTGLFSILSPELSVLIWFGASGSLPVFALGRWWTLLSASWLHGGLLHILFNMLLVRQLGPAMADIIGPSRTVIVYTVAGASGFLVSSVAGAYLGGARITVGASASIFGLLGALVHYGRTSSSIVKQQAVSYAVTMFVFGLIMPGIDNYAHAGGFAGGYATSWFLNPLTRERGDHLLVAIACLAATFLAVVVSVFHGLRLL
jgi:rhomboid protease GluP